MISNIHYIELYIQGELIELENQESLNLRINNVLFNPTQTSTKQAEYSFSFDIPSTPNNDRILNYANNLSKTNKFRSRYSAQVFADGDLIFDGSLTIQKYDAKAKMYTCNLVNIKINTLEEIFGDAVLTDVPWFVDFDGADTINAVNADPNSKYWFPLISYGAFIKDPASIDAYGVQDSYTSKYVIDSTNRWYISSFYPSLNVLEEMKKCFEWKGYNVGGNALYDPILSNIYASTNLANEQVPIYNVGKEKFGKLNINLQWEGGATLPDTHMKQDLRFPYFEIGGNYYDFVTQQYYNPQYNFTDIFINPLLKEGTINYMTESTMLIPDRSIIVIPADGFYKISLVSNVQLNQTSSITATQYVCNWNDNIGTMSPNAVQETITIPPDFKVTMPIEIQLIRNYDENIELIKGKYNLKVYDGHPDHETQCNKGRATNFFNYESCFPHEAAGTNGLYVNCTKADEISDWKERKSDANIGYMYADNTLHCYDPVVSDAFICGFTTMGSKNGGGCISFMKNGYSWSKTHSEKNSSLYYQEGYDRVWHDSGWTIHIDASTKNKNSLPNAPHGSHSQTSNSCSSSVHGMAYLRKNDVLELMAIRRGYWSENGTPVTYAVSGDVSLSIEAVSPDNIYNLKAKNYGWYDGTEFPTQLNLMNFTNKETKVSDWIKSVTDAFNLEITQSGQNIDINTNKGIKKTILNAIDIDDRVNSDEATSEYISYPKSMCVKYKIDTDEHGFYESVPSEHIEDEDWKEWGDSGYTIIRLNDDSYETSTQDKSTQFSYTWYDNFNVSGDVETVLEIPVISKEEYMIDGYDYEEAMKHDGYSLSQRFWFRNFNRHTTPDYLNFELKDDWFLTPNDEVFNNLVAIYTPKNQMDGFNLSYKDTEKSIVTEYFNIYPMLSSNYVTVETYLTPKEYKEIKGGALVHYDSDLYYTSEISGYDPSGGNTTKLKLIKKA